MIKKIKFLVLVDLLKKLGKIPSISGLVINSALTTVKNKMPDVSKIVKKTKQKTEYNTKISEIVNDHDDYITTSKFKKLTKEMFKARLTQENLVTKADFDAKPTSLNKKLTQIKQSIYLLKINWKNRNI